MANNPNYGRPISVRLPDHLRTRIEAHAAATRRSQGDVVREALERELANMEWEQGIIDLVEDLRAGRVKTVTLEEVEARLGLQNAPLDPDILDQID